VRIVQLSDTHLSHLGGVPNDNFSQLVDFVNNVLRPDLVVNSGDIVLLSPDSAEDREYARLEHERFSAPVRVVPGNHDVGMPGAHPWMGISTTSARVSNFRSSFGRDRFVELADEHWAIVGMNSEILSSGLAEEADQWVWLAHVAGQVGDRSVMLFLHRPLWSPVDGPREHELALTDRDRERLLQCFSGKLRVVGSGHLHRYLQSREGDVLRVSAPSTAFIVRSGPLGFGLNQLGVVEYRLDGAEVEAYFRAAPTLVEEEPFTMPAFVATMASIEASTAGVG
jgi:3',5'-cyclic AMP phosphodiesterase CpdA